MVCHLSLTMLVATVNKKEADAKAAKMLRAGSRFDEAIDVEHG